MAFCVPSSRHGWAEETEGNGAELKGGRTRCCQGTAQAGLQRKARSARRRQQKGRRGAGRGPRSLSGA